MMMGILPIWLSESKPAGITKGLLGSVDTDFLKKKEKRKEKKFLIYLKRISKILSSQEERKVHTAFQSQTPAD